MQPELHPERAAVDAALAAWRRKAGEALLVAAAAVHLPGFVLLLLGYGPPMAPLMKAIAIPAYVILLAAALWRRVEFRTRLWGFFVAAYLWVAVAEVAAPRGPYAQIGLVTVPILALVLAGAGAARIAVLASVGAFMLGAFLRGVPGVAQTLAIDPSQTTGPWMQAAVMAVWLVAFTVLLVQFQRFLLNSLAAQYRATAALEREAVQRLAAQRKLDSEMQERQRLEREIAAIGDAERRRLGRELHDGVCQQIAAALLRSQALERRLELGGTVSGADFAPLSSLLAETVDDAHNVALGLCALEPNPDALAPALRALTKRTQEMSAVRCEFLASGDVRVPDPIMAQHLYRIAQEALSNAMRHARPNRIAVELRGRDDEWLLRVENDGMGMSPDRSGSGMGLRTMAYRAQILQGALTVAPAPGGGTRVTCRVPRAAGPPAGPPRSGDQTWAPTT